ncbi:MULTISPECIES: hypothetical protein [unclassified Methanopyrus]|uniref:hypothetical protein n=1 Tax=Methanopyrus sp. SNP6 TaxID=1937005 RepID=UPI0011E5ADB0|nr:hypothetical protein [Methanopyrus sp. SNP6]
MFAYMMKVLPTLLDAVVEEVNADKDHSETFRTEPWSGQPNEVVETRYIQLVRRLVREGRNVVLVGEPGSGKSTTAMAACEKPVPVVLTFSRNLPVSILKTFVNTLRVVGPRRLISADAAVVGDAVIDGEVRRLPLIDEFVVFSVTMVTWCLTRALKIPIIAMLATDKKYYAETRKILELAGFEVVEIRPDKHTVKEVLRAHGLQGSPRTNNPREELKRFSERSSSLSQSDE